MAHRASVLFLMYAAACSTGAQTSLTSSPAEVMAVPLTAASASIATSAPIHEDVQPPWTLTASDGSGLLLSRVDAKAVFEGPLAFTELHLYFFNPENRTREGTFQITLPQGAAVSRFAMETNGQWMEAEVVEKQLARRAYDDFLHRRQDPALLEKAAGNQFTAKVFPIAGNAEKHIVISYSQELPGTPYVLPLRGLPKTERVDVSLQMTDDSGKKTEQKLSERNWQPDRDFVSTGALAASAVGASGIIAAQVPLGTWIAKQEAPTGITLLVDTSASRGLGYEGYVASVQKLVESIGEKWGKDLPVELVAFDQDAEPIWSGRAGALTAEHMKKLVERGAAGASDLGQALAWTAQHSPLARVVVVTDGVVTAGREGDELKKQVAALAQQKVDRIDFVLAGGLRDDKAMAALVRSGLPKAGAVLDLDRDDVAKALGESVLLDVAIDVPGATWVYPRTISTARAGSQAVVYAKFKQPVQTVEVKVGQGANRIAVRGGTAPLVERAFASAEIEDLEAQLVAATKPEVMRELRQAIAKRSVAARVISSQTSLLVLESDADYARYGIDRKALADVLVVGANGIERKGRAGIVQLAQPDQVAANKRPKPTETKNVPAKKVAADKAEEAFAKEQKDANLEMDVVAGKQSGAQFDLDGTGMAEGAKGEAGPSGGEGGVEGGVVGGVVGGALGGVAAPSTTTPPPPPPAPTAEPAPAMERRPAPPREVERRAAAVRSEEEASSRRMVARDDDGEDESEGRDQPLEQSRDAWPPKDAPVALTGELAQINKLLKQKDVDGALAKARDWHAREPGNVLALIGLGDALEAKGSAVTAARIYGSIIDLFPGRADMRRFAGERLSRLQARAKDLIVDTFRRAVADRPDHMTGHRLYAYSLVRAGKPADAFKAILAGIDQQYRGDSYRGGDRVLAEDAGMIGAAYAAAEPGKKAEIVKELGTRGLSIATKPSTRFILYWETDANDVDFHIQDARGGHAFYSNMHLPSGGDLYADITTGYGPECFAIPGTPNAGPYRLSINYYSQGPMGYGMGLLEIQRFDGKGGLQFEDRPYVIMNDHAYVDLGTTR
ncbi:MAG: hypothetical protein HOV81_31790 [Kofleriaceae bacterium]|nr:hypothetical protein [Kofleriaceae bacterium]